MAWTQFFGFMIKLIERLLYITAGIVVLIYVYFLFEAGGDFAGAFNDSLDLLLYVVEKFTNAVSLRFLPKT